MLDLFLQAQAIDAALFGSIVVVCVVLSLIGWLTKASLRHRREHIEEIIGDGSLLGRRLSAPREE